MKAYETKHPLAALMPSARAALVGLATLVLAGCVWPMDPVPEWDFSYQGTVRRSDTGAPVPDAQVQIWFVHPNDWNSDAPSATGQTDVSGRFDIYKRERTRAQPANVTIRVTPPAGSGLAAHTLGGNTRDVFTDIRRSEHTVTFHTNLVLAP
jgi:hypothetical protein